MAFTTHGHHIPGTVKGDIRPTDVKRCGGVQICHRCQAEADEHMAFMIGENVNYQQRATDKLRQHLTRTLGPNVRPFTIYVIWFAKTLQNWKAILGTTLDDCMIYELTYDGNKRQTYLDSYHKNENITIPD